MNSQISASSQGESAPPLDGRHVAFVGKLGGVTRREAQQLVRKFGGVAVDRLTPQVNLVVVGADELPLGEQDEMLGPELRDAVAAGQAEIISETQLWERVGMVDIEQNVRLYTPAMLADLLDVPVTTIRRWHRRGLIVPAREVRRLPYFDFQEVATAQRLAQLLAAGASPDAIEKKLGALARYVPDVERPLAQLSIIVEGQQILLRQGEGLIEPGGQLRIDFDALSAAATGAANRCNDDVLSLTDPAGDVKEFPTPSEMLEFATRLEDEGRLDQAMEMYRAILASTGPDPEVCFLLAEILYRTGDVSAARERYYMAIELDEDYVEARANLGCVLAETGQPELAVAAFEGTLLYHRDYPDVHYHLARTLDELGESEKADEHWEEFLSLAPDSPWANEARDRLELELS